MPALLDALLVVGSLLAAGVYLLIHLYLRKGRGSCCPGGEASNRDRMQIQLPKR
jgi:hypothetical protein